MVALKGLGTFTGLSGGTYRDRLQLSFQICAADCRITLLVTIGGLGLAHPEVPSPQSPFPGLGHPPWSILSLMGLLGCRQVQPVSRKSLRGPAHLSSHLGTISFPRCCGCCSMGQPCLCFRPVRSMCLPAGRSPFLSSRLCCWLLLAAARDTVLILCRFALILFRSGRLLCLRQNT